MSLVPMGSTFGQGVGFPFGPKVEKRYAEAGYAVVESRDSLTKLSNDPAKPLLGVFYDSHLPL